MNLKNNRRVMWDMSLCENSSGVELTMHRPIKRNIAFSCDAPWEGDVCGYGSTVKVGNTVRLYYRAGRSRLAGGDTEGQGIICVAESYDGGITFTKPNIGRYEYKGSYDNNIVYSDGYYIDNFSVYYDPNPDCPEDAKFKALASHGLRDGKAQLEYYKSSDGYSFTFSHIIDVYGAYDTLNILLWDDSKKVYRVYVRSFHAEDGSDIDVTNDYLRGHSLRDIRTAESTDMIHWTKPEHLVYEDGDTNLQLYTNGITKYHRADIFYGTPSRYYDRVGEYHNIKYLPTLYGRREELMKTEKRGGTAMTDCIIMTSYDGKHFARSAEAFLTPGPQDEENWIYGDCYPARGLVETPSEYKGCANELSLYCGKGYRARPLDFERYTLRLDGLYSWYAKAKGGNVLTKPVVMGGNKLSVNFATSALGSLRIKICDENGTPVEGYDSLNLFGDTVDRNVDFEKPLGELSGKTVRLSFELSDCHLYSFIFE